MLLFLTDLFRKRLHRWFAGGALAAFCLVVAMFTNISVAGAAGEKGK